MKLKLRDEAETPEPEVEFWLESNASGQVRLKAKATTGEEQTVLIFEDNRGQIQAQALPLFNDTGRAFSCSFGRLKVNVSP